MDEHAVSKTMAMFFMITPKLDKSNRMFPVQRQVIR
jgi:hypothetical protein